MFDLVSGARNNGKCGGGFRKGTARRRRRRRHLFGCFCLIIYIYISPLKCIFFRTSKRIICILFTCVDPVNYHLGSSVYIYNIHIIYAANTPSHADIEHYDLHSNWNEISTKVDRRRRIEIYSCRWFLTLFGYGLIIWFGHSFDSEEKTPGSAYLNKTEFWLNFRVNIGILFIQILSIEINRFGIVMYR